MVGKVEDKLYVSVEEASSIMGKNFFGINHARDFFDFDPMSSQYQGLKLHHIPYSRDILDSHKSSHFLVFLSPISINNMKTMYPSLFRSAENFYRAPFAKKEGELGWYLIEKKPKEDLFSKKFDEQCSSVVSNEEIVSAQVLIYFLLANFLLNDECVLFDSSARCPDFYVLDFRTRIGKFDINAGGISVSSFWDTAGLPTLSVLTFLKGNI